MNQNQTESKPPSVEEPREEGLDETTCSPSSDTPETDTAVKTWRDPETGKRNRMVPAGLSRKIERERNHWRNEHDRVVREYQHRLMVIGTSVIEATSYPENVKGVAAPLRDSVETGVEP